MEWMGAGSVGGIDIRAGRAPVDRLKDPASSGLELGDGGLGGVDPKAVRGWFGVGIQEVPGVRTELVGDLVDEWLGEVRGAHGSGFCVLPKALSVVSTGVPIRLGIVALSDGTVDRQNGRDLTWAR